MADMVVWALGLGDCGVCLGDWAEGRGDSV